MITALETTGERGNIVVDLLNVLILLKVSVERRHKVRVSQQNSRRTSRQNTLNDKDQLENRGKGNEITESKVDRGKEANEDPVSIKIKRIR